MGSTSSGFDSHTPGMNEQFIGCQVWDAPVGFGLRGRQHMVRDCMVRQVDNGVYLIDEGTGGQSWGHTIENFKAERAGIVFYSFVNGRDPSQVSYGQPEYRPITVHNVMATDTQGKIFQLNGGTWIVSNFDNWFSTLTAIGGDLTNAALEIYRARMDYRDVPAGTAPHALFSMHDAQSSLIIRDMDIKNNSTFLDKFVNNNAASVVQVDRLRLDAAPVTALNNSFTATNSWVDWIKATGSPTNSAFIVSSDLSTSSLVGVGLSNKETIVVKTTQSAAGTITALPAGKFYGQKLIIDNVGTGSVTINHSPGANHIHNPGGSAYVIGGSGTVPSAATYYFDSDGNWKRYYTSIS